MRIRWALWLGLALAVPAHAQSRKAAPPAPGTTAAPPEQLPEWAQGTVPSGDPAARPLLPRFVWDLPEVIGVIDMPGEQVAMGTPVKLRAVHSRSSLSEAYEYMMRAFERGGLYVAPPGTLNIPLSDPVLTGLDGTRLFAYTVIFKANPDGTTTLILGESDLGRRQKTQRFFAPLPPDARSPMQTQVEGMRTLVYTTAERPEQVLGFYRQALGAAGFEEIEPRLFRKGQTLWKVRASREDGRTQVTVIDSAYLPAAGPIQPHGG